MPWASLVYALHGPTPKTTEMPPHAALEPRARPKDTDAARGDQPRDHAASEAALLVPHLRAVVARMIAPDVDYLRAAAVAVLDAQGASVKQQVAAATRPLVAQARETVRAAAFAARRLRRPERSCVQRRPQRHARRPRGARIVRTAHRTRAGPPRPSADDDPPLGGPSARHRAVARRGRT